MFTVYGSNRMNNVEGRQLARGRHSRFAGWQPVGKPGAANLATCFEDFRSAGAMNRAVNSTAAEQRRIRGVHDRIDILARDVTHDDADTTSEKSWFAFRAQEV